jgi:tRNA threonylcarbamoyladenosine biosynthesis protein TsaE
VFVLSSDLGGGKTTFTKGLAAGLGVDANVTSPTFNISRIHKGRDNLSLYHFDFYRLHEAGVIAHELAEALDDPSVICAIEWGDIIDSILPPGCVKIIFERAAGDDDVRILEMTVPAERAYLTEGL